MKPKTAPTSPKYKQSAEEIKKLYFDKSLAKFSRPESKRTSIITTIFISLFFGFVAGIFSILVIEILLINYPDWTIWRRINLVSSSNQNQPPLVQKPQNTLTNVWYQLALDTKPVLVNIFSKKELSGDLNQIYGAADFRGNGIILSSDGWLVTTKNVVADSAAEVVVMTNDQTIYPVTQILFDEATDLSFLKIEAEGLTAANFASPDDLFEGDEFLALQNNISLNQINLRVAQLEAKNYKKYESPPDFIESTERYSRRYLLSETLATLYEGSAIINQDKEVVGIILSREENRRLAFPLYQISNLLRIILREKKIERPYLGVHYIDLSASNNLPEKLSHGFSTGALVIGDQEAEIPAVISDSPADKSGLKRGDIILRVNTIDIDQTKSLTEVIQDLAVGETVELDIFRQDQESEISVKLEKLK